jgi:hypothetical protein
VKDLMTLCMVMAEEKMHRSVKEGGLLLVDLIRKSLYDPLSVIELCLEHD